jgi:hypothetical protein
LQEICEFSFFEKQMTKQEDTSCDVTDKAYFPVLYDDPTPARARVCVCKREVSLVRSKFLWKEGLNSDG